MTCELLNFLVHKKFFFFLFVPKLLQTSHVQIIHASAQRLVIIKRLVFLKIQFNLPFYVFLYFLSSHSFFLKGFYHFLTLSQITSLHKQKISSKKTASCHKKKTDSLALPHSFKKRVQRFSGESLISLLYSPSLFRDIESDSRITGYIFLEFKKKGLKVLSVKLRVRLDFEKAQWGPTTRIFRRWDSQRRRQHGSRGH